MAYACVRTDNMSGTVNGKDLVSLKFMVGETEAPVENGNVVLVGDHLEGEREVRKATAPSKNADVYIDTLYKENFENDDHYLPFDNNELYITKDDKYEGCCTVDGYEFTTKDFHYYWTVASKIKE